MANTKNRIIAVFAAMMLAAATFVCMAGSAWADELPDSNYESVTFTVNGSSYTTNVNIANMLPASSVTLPTVGGQFYKNNAWSVLATNRYVTINSIIDAAVAAYNNDWGAELDRSDVWYSGKTISVKAVETDRTSGNRYVATYAKYTWSYDELTSATSFFNVDNSTTTLSGTPSSTNNVAVLAYTYGSCVVEDSVTDTDAAKTTALNSQTTSTYPRLILGCESGWDTTQAMGKRYCYDVVGIIIS